MSFFSATGSRSEQITQSSPACLVELLVIILTARTECSFREQFKEISSWLIL